MKDRRQYHRFNVELNAQFSASGSTEHMTKGTIVNLSGTGISMSMKEKLELGQEIGLRVELPGSDSPVALRAKVIYCNATGRIGEYRAGIKIQDRISEGASSFLQFYSEKLKNYPKDLTD